MGCDTITTLLQEAQNLQETIRKHRRYIHENAEVNDELPVTTAYVKSCLAEMGYQPEEICKSGIVATIGKASGKTILLRADMDALPIMEENDLSFKSISGRMHACGHDMHTAMLLGAAKLLKDHEDILEGQVKLMFQPGEEPMTGAAAMVEAGVLENPKVDTAFMVHVTTGMPVPTGAVIIPQGGIMSASSDWYTVSIQGKGGHGAMPNSGVDPLNILSHIYLAFQTVNSREVAPGDNMVLTVGQMHGGKAANVIPDTAFLSGTIRTFSEANREFVKKRVEDISEGVAATLRGSANVKFEKSCPSLKVDQQLRDEVAEYAIELLGKETVMDMKQAFGISQLPGTEDFAFVCKKVPGMSVMIGAGNKEEGFPYPPHHPKADFNENALPIGAALYANTAIEWLKHNN